ncbi:MAG: Lysophospholipase, alpha-beta hydrolase superfamily [Hyphomicrobiales bacterium]|nr:Lysophospholipase, alpha-beta hydrolase superfamily [Hyphomicrobiales bacterium]
MRLFRTIMNVGLLATALIGTLGPASAERAASIDYQFVDRSPTVPSGFAASADNTLRFLRITTLGNSFVDAALWQPKESDPAKQTLIISVHGSGDNFVKPPVGFLSPALATKGYAVLAINTRQHDDLVNTDNFLHIRQDIDAAVYTARALGYSSIVMHGHSIGNIQVQFYVATAWAPDIKAMVLTGMFGNLPWKSRNMLIQNEQNFSALMEASHNALRDGRTGDVMPVKMRWFTGQEVPMTAQHFLTYRSEASSTADGTYWIKRIPVPILMVRDASDAVVAPFEPYMLLSSATSQGSLVPSIEYKLLPDDKPVSLDNHYFVNNQQPLVTVVTDWLAGKKLQ